jgi:hypothetical protein
VGLLSEVIKNKDHFFSQRSGRDENNNGENTMTNLRKTAGCLIIALASAFVLSAATVASAQEARCVPIYDDTPIGPFCTLAVPQ